jgi:hypothetical protein
MANSSDTTSECPVFDRAGDAIAYFSLPRGSTEEAARGLAAGGDSTRVFRLEQLLGHHRGVKLRHSRREPCSRHFSNCATSSWAGEARA